MIRHLSLFLLAAWPLSGAELPSGRVTFARPDGPYPPEVAAADFGNGSAAATRRVIDVKDQALHICFPAGRKVNGTGLGFTAKIPAQTVATLEFRIKYDGNFETGLHGKQFGLSGGRGYTGGLGRECRANGDGWSVRLQFDAHDDGIANQLYVYHCGMTGIYGESLGSQKQRFKFSRGEWHRLRLTVTMQSRPDAADGRIEVWCDGVKRIDVPGVRLVTQEAGRNINRLRLESFPGGGGRIPTRDSHLWIDDITWFPGRAP